MSGRDEILRSVSRSFYLSLRFLPPPMRGPVSLAYLLARFSDTLADAPGLPQEERLAWIEDFRQVIQGKRERLAGDPGKLAPLLDHEGERELVKRGEELVSEYRSLPSGLREPVSEVLLTILDGQSWDLRAFSDGPFACRTGDDLLLYTYRVAGCVGEFWTRIGYAVLGERFADPGQADAMLESGRKLGQALQLTNILRDLHEDLPRGRCYLPTDGTDFGRMRPVFEHWLGVARGFLDEADTYLGNVRSFRVRLCSRLPQQLARATLDRLEAEGLETVLQRKVKISRGRVWLIFARALFG